MAKKHKYDPDFVKAMAEDPNMGADPAWIKKNPNFKVKHFKVVSTSKGGRSIKYDV